MSAAPEMGCYAIDVGQKATLGLKLFRSRFAFPIKVNCLRLLARPSTTSEANMPTCSHMTSQGKVQKQVTVASFTLGSPTSMQELTACHRVSDTTELEPAKQAPDPRFVPRSVGQDDASLGAGWTAYLRWQMRKGSGAG